MNNYLISIIIPTRNRRNYVTDLLKDIEDQVLPEGVDAEIIVVDQSDNEVPMDNCRYFHLKTLGPCVSRNFAVENSNGEILIFLDDDARIGSTFISEMINPIISGNYVAVAGAVCDINGKYPKTEEDFLQKKDFNFIKTLTANPNTKTSRPTISFPGCCAAIKKNIFLSIGGFDESFDPTGAGEDRDLAVNLFSKGHIVFYNHKAKLLHIGANSGGSRDVGSRTMYLDINSYKICKKYFSETQSAALKKQILDHYKAKFLTSIRKIKGARTYYHNFRKVKRELDRYEL